QAYGERNPELLRWVGRDEMARNAPPDTEFEAGDMVEFVAPNGGRYSGVLKTLRDDAALFDFNHPLAGIDLQVEVKIPGGLGSVHAPCRRRPGRVRRARAHAV